jgi:hypothetical protein
MDIATVRRGPPRIQQKQALWSELTVNRFDERAFRDKDKKKTRSHLKSASASEIPRVVHAIEHPRDINCLNYLCS